MCHVIPRLSIWLWVLASFFCSIMVEEDHDQSAREAKATGLAKAWENVPQLRRAAKSFSLVLALT